MSAPRALAVAVALLASAVGTASVNQRMARLTGNVVDQAGKPAVGAKVTACATRPEVCITGYTGHDGNFALEGLWPMSYVLTASSSETGVASRPVKVAAGANARLVRVKLSLPMGTSTLTDIDYLETLPDGAGKVLLRSVCIQCHGLAERVMIRGKTREEWEATVDRMLAKIAPLPNGERETIIAYLTENVSPERAAAATTAARAFARNAPSVSTSTNAQIFEYQMPPQRSNAYDKTTGAALTTHDVRVDKNGYVWVSEMSRDALVRLDPRTGSFVEYPIPYPGSGPHGIILDKSGNVWITLIWGDRLMKFDPQKDAFTVDVKIPGSQSWPHTIAYDSRGRLWYTEMYANAIGMFDPASSTFDRFPVPTERATPYGLSVDKHDNVWFAGITYHKVGKIDPGTRQVTEFPTREPFSATRKVTIDHEGNVWCTLFGAGKIARIEPATGRLTEFDLPQRYSAPYDITVSPDGRVWFPDFTGNRVIAFRPAAKSFDEYEIPTKLARPRIIDADPDGSVWFSESEVGKVAHLIPR